MALCTKITGTHRQVCSGKLRHLIEIKTRTIMGVDRGGYSFDENLVTKQTVRALLITKRGVQFFDSHNILRTRRSHDFYIRYIPAVTFVDFVTFQGQNYKILDVEDLDERHEYYLLQTVVRGDDTLPTNRL